MGSFKTNSSRHGKKIIFWALYARTFERHHLSSSERIERARNLAAQGNIVYLLAADFEKEHYQKNPNLHLVSIPIRNFSIISPFLYGLWLFFFLPVYLTKIRPNFLICDSSIAFYLCWKPVVAKLLNFKVILDIRTTPVNPFSGPRSFINDFRFNLSVFVAKSMFDGMTIITPMMKNEICQRFHINPKWVGILSGGVSSEFLDYDKKLANKRNLLRKKFGLLDKLVVLYHGSLRFYTGGIIETIKALSLIKQTCPEIVFLMLTATPESSKILLDRLLKANAVENIVTVLGPVDHHEVPQYISLSDVGIVPLPDVPAWRHQQPLKLLEYMAMQKPIILSDIPAHRALLGENKNAIFLAHVTPEEIAKALVYCRDNIEKLREYAKIGREIVLKNFTWNKASLDLIEYLSSVQFGRIGRKGN